MPAVVGRAVARVKGYYPAPTGVCASVKVGSVFDIVEGYPVDTWADALPADALPAGQRPAKGRRQASAPPPADDIA
jgi:hypothetical protein